MWRPAGGLPACTCATYAPALARPRAHPPRSANDGLTFASWTCWNSLFLLHTWQAIRLLPQDPDFHLIHARVCLARGKPKEAIKALEQARKWALPEMQARLDSKLALLKGDKS